MSLRSAAESLLDRWSAKDADGVADLLADDVVLTGPLAPGGRVQGAAKVREFLRAQNTTRSGLPSEELPYHERMASSRATITRLIEQGSTVAFQGELHSPERPPQQLALFLDVNEDGRIGAVTIYFNSPPTT